MNSEHLRTFLHVCDAGSLSGASRTLHLTQPAISRQIHLLEDSVGSSLFERTGRGMELTERGRWLAGRARTLLLELDGLSEEIHEGPITGRVSIGVSPSVGAVWTAGLVERLRKQLPGIKLHMVFMLSGALGELVARGSLDLGILYSPTVGQGLMTRKLWEESSHLVTSRRSLLARQSTIRLRKVIETPLVLPSSRFGVRALLERHALELEEELRLEAEIDSVQLALELVRRGVGSMILTERALADLDPGDFAALPIVRPRLQRSAQVIVTESSLRRQAVSAVWSVCGEREVTQGKPSTFS